MAATDGRLDSVDVGTEHRRGSGAGRLPEHGMTASRESAGRTRTFDLGIRGLNPALQPVLGGLYERDVDDPGASAEARSGAELPNNDSTLRT